MTAQQNAIDQNILQVPEDYFVNNESDISQTTKYFPQVVDLDKYNVLFPETSEHACSQNFMVKREHEDGIECLMDPLDRNDEDDCVHNFCSFVENGTAAWVNGNGTVRSESVINKTYVKNENTVGALQPDISSSTNDLGEGSGGRFSLLENRNFLTSEQLCHDDSSSDSNDESVEKDETLMEISRDGHSTEGTAGSEEIFGDREDPNYSAQNTITQALLEKLDVAANSEDVLNDGDIAMVNTRTSVLTPLYLETLNCSELDKTEYVRSFIQAWEPLDISRNGPPSCSSHSYDFSQPNKTFEEDSLDENNESSFFFQHSPETVCNKYPTNYWNDLRNDRAPWSTTRNVETVGRSIFSASDEEDDDETGWPKGETWNASSNLLTLCSLSTINEESDVEKERREIDM